MNKKWNDYGGDALYLWDGETLFVIKEGDGTNFSAEDEEEGYADYWMTDYYNEEKDVWDGGQWMEENLIAETDYTIEGVIERLKECDLWDSNWEILDEDVGERLEEAFVDYFNAKGNLKRMKGEANGSN